MTHLSVRELEERDIELITDYWLNSPPEYLTGMGVDLTKMPNRDEWTEFLSEQLKQTYKDKKSYCIIWEVNGKPIAHCNANKIVFGDKAYMHLHIWEAENRKKGLGTAFLKRTIPRFFANLQLNKLYCETYESNAAPGKALLKTGFKLINKYVSTPGWLNFEQPVNLWELGLKDLAI